MFFKFFIWFDVHIQQFLGLKFSTKLNRGILGLLDKLTIPETYRFPLANPQKGPSLDCVAYIESFRSPEKYRFSG